MNSLEIQYESEDFPPRSIAYKFNSLGTSWDDILWAAVTVGRPNRQYVFRHGAASSYEALFRWSLTRMAIEQSSLNAYRLKRTQAVKTLDPSEKGAVNYFLGMTFCKLFASKVLDTPWLLHLDVFRPMLNPTLTGRSRPDLVGKERTKNTWHAFESKGRASKPDINAKSKAKQQAQRLISVKGVNCSLHIGAITYFKSDVLQFYWRDPEPDRSKQIKITEIGDIWRDYYLPIRDLVVDRIETENKFENINASIRIEEADLEVSIHPYIAKAIFDLEWQYAHETAFEMTNELIETGYQPDGIKIIAGESWKLRFKDEGSEFK